jgi:Uma2 family endonuclease
MPVQARDIRHLSVEEYVTLDRESDERWEYANGEAWASRGASPEHAIGVRNIVVALTNALRGKTCLVFPDGQKIATRRTGAYHYPDASVVCSDPHYDGDDDRAIVNPTLVVEVLSPTTADYDRGGKLAHYRTLDSLEEYVIVAWDTKLVEHHRRGAPDQWLVTLVRKGSIDLTSIGVALVLEELWLDLERVR